MKFKFSMSTEWDRKFARMVAETERHLASVKARLSLVYIAC